MVSTSRMTLYKVNTLQEILEVFYFAGHITGSQTHEIEMIYMNDKELHEALFRLQQRFGTPTTFIAHCVDVSREHLSRWLHDHHESYAISNELKTKIKQFVKGEM